MQNDILSVARFKLQLKMPYLADGIFNLIPVVVPGFETMGVDEYWRLYHDPKVLKEKWTVDQVVTVLYHELNHLLRIHAVRGKHLPKENHMVWNVAGDAEINDDIENDSMFDLPGDCVTPSKYGFPNQLTAEEYYKLLFDSGQVKQISIASCGSAAHGQTEPHEMDAPDGTGTTPGVTAQDAEVISDKIAEKVSEEASKTRGTVPAGLARWADAHRSKKVDWRKLLAAYVKRAYSQKAGKNDYTYQRLSRRHQGEQVIMPSTFEPTPSVSVVIDTSGSMGQKEVSLALSEVKKILQQMGSREGVNVLCVDAEVTSARRVYTEKQIKVKGGGGTDMTVGITEAMKMKPRPDVVVVITDGYTPWPESRPSATVVVALTNEHTEAPPWAKTVRVNSDEE